MKGAGDDGSKFGDPGHGCVLVIPILDGFNGSLFGKVRAIEIRESLSEVYGIMLHRQSGDLRKDGLPESSESSSGTRLGGGIGHVDVESTRPEPGPTEI